MKIKALNSALCAAFLALAASTSLAQENTAAPAAAPAAKPYVAPPWTYKTHQLSKTEFDKLISLPRKVVILDVRRPDELIARGAFPAYLSIQIKDVEKYLDYIPKDRKIITVSNRAHRAGAAGDLLSQKGFKVAGAIGSLDYEDAGGTVARITPPPPRQPDQAAPR